MVDSNKLPWFHSNHQSVADAASFVYPIAFLDQPVVLMYVVSGTDDVVKEIQKMKADNEKIIRSMFVNNDKDIDQVKKFILVLNDAQAATGFN
jgi:ribosomal protein S6